jgi:hypothetical protein
MIYNNLEDKSEVLAIDSRTLQVKSRWPIAPAGAPAPIAMDREHRRLFVAGREPATVVVARRHSEGSHNAHCDPGEPQGEGRGLDGARDG